MSDSDRTYVEFFSLSIALIYADAARKQTFSEQGDAGPDCVSPGETFVNQAEASSLPKKKLPKKELPKKELPKIPCTYCGKEVGRMQELKRHLLLNLPNWILCRWPECSSTYYRPYDLKMHMKDEHQISDFKFERSEVQIYNPNKLLESMVKGTLSVEKAADVALSMAKEGLAEGQAGVVLWEKRTRFCNGK
jgi:hypothetical protein